MTPDPEPQSPVVEADELLLRPGTYFNPQTEVVVIVDDSASADQEIFNMGAYEGAEWVRISDDVPGDEEALDQALVTFQPHYHPRASRSVSAPALAQRDVDEHHGERGHEAGR